MKFTRIIHGISKINCFLFSNTIGRIGYKSRYFTGKHFKSIRSAGWSWVAKDFFPQKICGWNREVPWPVSPHVHIWGWENIEFDNNDLNNFQTFGTYFQAYNAKIIIQKGTFIAPNVGLITSNHDVNQLEEHLAGKNITIGKNCWIGMNSVILPGVTLGDHTIVGAGSVVTKSFAEGNCVIAGNPARIVKTLKKSE